MVPMMLTVVGTALTPTSVTLTVGMAETASGLAVRACVMRHAPTHSTATTRAISSNQTIRRLLNTLGGAGVSDCCSNKIVLMTPHPPDHFLCPRRILPGAPALRPHPC